MLSKQKSACVIVIFTFVKSQQSKILVADLTCSSTDLEVDVINELAAFKLQSPNTIADRVRRWDYDYITATYFLLMERKQRGFSIRLTPSTSPVIGVDSTHQRITPKRMLFSEQAINGGQQQVWTGHILHYLFLFAFLNLLICPKGKLVGPHGEDIFTAVWWS